MTASNAVRSEFKYLWDRAKGERREQLREWAYHIGVEDIVEGAE